MNSLHNALMFDDDKEAKLAKKRGRVIRTAAWSIGLGIGLLVARYVGPLIMGESDVANAGFSGFGFALVGYGLAQLAVLFLLRRQGLLICSVITYFVMPAIFLKLIMDISG